MCTESCGTSSKLPNKYVSDLELRNGESQFLLRARVGPEKGWLVKSFNWTGILEAKSDLRLLVIKDSVQHGKSLTGTC